MKLTKKAILFFLVCLTIIFVPSSVKASPKSIPGTRGTVVEANGTKYELLYNQDSEGNIYEAAIDLGYSDLYDYGGLEHNWWSLALGGTPDTSYVGVLTYSSGYEQPPIYYIHTLDAKKGYFWWSYTIEGDAYVSLYFSLDRDSARLAKTNTSSLIQGVSRIDIRLNWLTERPEEREKEEPEPEPEPEPIPEPDVKGGDGLIDALGKSGTYKDEDIENVGEKIVNIIQIIGVVIAVAVLVLLGFKFVTGSVEERSNIKKSMIPYFVGAILVFATTTIVKVIYYIATIK